MFAVLKSDHSLKSYDNFAFVFLAVFGLNWGSFQKCHHLQKIKFFQIKLFSLESCLNFRYLHFFRKIFTKKIPPIQRSEIAIPTPSSYNKSHFQHLKPLNLSNGNLSLRNRKTMPSWASFWMYLVKGLKRMFCYDSWKSGINQKTVKSV